MVQSHLFAAAFWAATGVTPATGDSAAVADESELEDSSGCALVGEEPWASFRRYTADVLACAAHSPGCRLPGPPYRILSQFADGLIYGDVGDYGERTAQCPLGFAAGMAIVCIFSQLESQADPLAMDSLLRLASSQVAPHAAGLLAAAQATPPRFGLARPLALLQDLRRIARRRLINALAIPALMAPDHAAPALPTRLPRNASRASSHGAAEDDAAQALDGLVVRLAHSADRPLAVLRNAVETLATAGLLRRGGRGARLALWLDRCDNAWARDAAASEEAWYLRWLQERFDASIACGGEAGTPSTKLAWPRQARYAAGGAAAGERYSLWLSSTWYLLPFPAALVAARLQEAIRLLSSGGEDDEGARQRRWSVAAVSLSEKTSLALGSVAGAGKHLLASFVRQQPIREDLRALALSSPALSGNFDMAASARQAEALVLLGSSAPAPAGASAAASTTTWLGAFAAGADAASAGTAEVSSEPETIRPCDAAEGFEGPVCGPASWFPGVPDERATSQDDVWLTRGGDAAAPSGATALAKGLFLQTTGVGYDATPSAEGMHAVGTPDCFACDLVESQASSEFTLYLAPMDVMGPCRELFSNLLLDALEALQLASFQGPSVKIVEPFISNAVWRRFSKQDAEELRASKEGTSIYSFWNKDTSCGLRHASAVRFGDLFDWPALAEKLQAERGLQGAASWQEFLDATGSSLDALAMLSHHPGSDSEPALTPCEDSEEPGSLRFFDDDLQVRRRICVRSTDERHGGGFELRFLDIERLRAALRGAVQSAQASGRNWASVGLFFYWVESAERARLHPGRYGVLGVHSLYGSIWSGLRFAPGILRRAASIVTRLGLRGRRYLAAHWRRGDWFLGPHPRKLEQAALADPAAFAAVLRRHLAEQQLDRVFLMTNAPAQGADVQELIRELGGKVVVVQAPVLKGDRYALHQLSVEMAIASEADFFVAFGDGLVSGMASMPSLLVLHLRLHALHLPLEANAFSFAQPWQDGLGL